MQIRYCPCCGWQRLNETDFGFKCSVCNFEFYVKEKEQENVGVVPDPYLEYLETDC